MSIGVIAWWLGAFIYFAALLNNMRFRRRMRNELAEEAERLAFMQTYMLTRTCNHCRRRPFEKPLSVPQPE